MKLSTFLILSGIFMVSVPVMLLWAFPSTQYRAQHVVTPEKTLTLPPTSDTLVLEPRVKPSPSPKAELTWEARSKLATPVYAACIKVAKKSKNPCAADICGDAYIHAVWPEHDRRGYSNESYCETQIKERKQQVACVRKALKIKDQAERLVSLKECGV